MRLLALVLLAGCSLAGAACASTQGSTPATTPAAEPDLYFLTDADPRVFGAPCQPELDAIHCGTKVRVSVVIKLRGGYGSVALPPPPCRYIELDPLRLRDGGARGCVKGERLFLAASCLMCRQASEWSMVGLVAEMTDTQLAVAHKHVGLTTEPLLRSPGQWHDALAGASAAAVRVGGVAQPGVAQP